MTLRENVDTGHIFNYHYMFTDSNFPLTDHISSTNHVFKYEPCFSGSYFSLKEIKSIDLKCYTDPYYLITVNLLALDRQVETRAGLNGLIFTVSVIISM